MDTVNRSAFGKLLQESRERAGITRNQLADLVKLDASHLFRIEKGQRSPSRDTALALADALELDDSKVNELQVAAGFAPIPALGAIRGALRARGAVRTRSAARSVTSGAVGSASWTVSERANRLESIGLSEGVVRRVLDAMASASLASQEEAGRALSAAFASVAETLESPARVAVIPAAGGHHRLLAAHVMQRLLLSSIREAVRSGIREIVLILAPSGVEALYGPLKQALGFSVAPRIDLRYREQTAPDGLGAAVLLARSEVGSGPFAVLLPDDRFSEGGASYTRGLRRMLRVAAETPDACLIAVDAVSKSALRHAGAARLSAKAVKDRVFRVLEVAENPPSDAAILRARRVRGIVGRYVLQPGLFAAIAEHGARNSPPVELTDGLALWMRRGGQLLAYEIESGRTDIGLVLDEAQSLIEGA